MPTLLWQTYALLYDGLLDLLTYRDMVELVVDAADCLNRTVVDVGAGTGNITRALVDAGAAHVTAVDSSPNMLRRAHRKLASEVRKGTVRLVRGDVNAALGTLGESSVDRLTAVNVLYAVKHREAFFTHAHRVLRPDGFLVVAHTTRPGVGPIARDQFRRGGLRACVHPRLAAIGVIDTVIDILAHAGRYDFAPVEVLAREAAAAGLVRTQSLGRCYGGDDGVNELLIISAAPRRSVRSNRVSLPLEPQPSAASPR